MSPSLISICKPRVSNMPEVPRVPDAPPPHPSLAGHIRRWLVRSSLLSIFISSSSFLSWAQSAPFGGATTSCFFLSHSLSPRIALSPPLARLCLSRRDKDTTHKWDRWVRGGAGYWIPFIVDEAERSWGLFLGIIHRIWQVDLFRKFCFTWYWSFPTLCIAVLGTY